MRPLQGARRSLATGAEAAPGVSIDDAALPREVEWSNLRFPPPAFGKESISWRESSANVSKAKPICLLLQFRRVSV